MGCWDVYCTICGCPCSSNLSQFEDGDLAIDKKIIYWLNKCTFLTKNNKIIHKCEETNCNINFEAPNNAVYYATLDDKELSYPYLENIGLCIHDDCWKYIYQKYNIKLKFNDFALFDNNKNKKLNYYNENLLPYVKYNHIQKYWGQDFDYESLIKDNNLWFCESPLKSTKNAIRLNKIIKQLKIKPNRKGPTVSASLYKSGVIKYGNNNKFWINNKGKWIEMKGIITNTIIEFNKKKP
jgi:hypothetical protein